MKKIMSLVLALTLLCSMVCVASAAQEDFVASITYKPAPEIVPVGEEDGQVIIGYIYDENGNVIGKIYEDCLLVTPISQAATSDKIPDDAEALLIQVYNQLVAGSMTLPYEKVAGYNGETMVIRELVDATWLCEDSTVKTPCPDVVEPPKVVFQITFDLGVAAGTNVVVMTYKQSQWNPIVATKNNGDGTVTCTFEDLCPVAFAVPTKTVPTPGTGDSSNPLLWGVLMGVSAVALVALVVVYSRKRKVA